MGRNAEDTAKVLTNGHILACVNWSQPPGSRRGCRPRGAEDAELTRQWLAELDTMRARMREVRDALAGADNRVAGLDLTALASQNGLFSILRSTRTRSSPSARSTASIWPVRAGSTSPG